jgi:hypothetical protein
MTTHHSLMTSSSQVPNSAEVAKMTPRVPSSGDMTARRLAAADSPMVASPSITQTQLSPLSTQTLSYLSKKLVHLSVMLEQDTVLSDTSYPSFDLGRLR